MKLRINFPCVYDNQPWILKKFISSEKVIIEHQNEKYIKTVHPEQIVQEIESGLQNRQLEQISDQEWEEAQRRFSILRLLDTSLDSVQEKSVEVIIAEVAEANNISSRTLYRWKKLYDSSGLISSLAPLKSSGGRGKGRVDLSIERLMREVIHDFHFQSLNPKVSKSYRELKKRCKKLNVASPSQNTFRSRINLLTRQESLEKRKGKAETKQLTQPIPGSYPQVQSPLEVIQIDHTLLDIIVVNENRKPIGRPWITLAIDIYSRMVTGFYISFDSPGTLGTGICIANSILSKEQTCMKYGLKSEWPVEGIMSNIHSDNAPEFKSKAIRMACQEYGINLLYRAKGNTHWGGHIERLLGNFLHEIHLIPGTTFSNTKSRREYDSEKESILTLAELEEWLHVFIVDIYHQSIHSSLGVSPITKYYEGILSSENELPSGIGEYNFDPVKLKIDFLPSVERTIQRTGVVIDHLRYYADILSPYIYFSRSSQNLHLPKLRSAEKYLFKRDPRDLSCIYFLDPHQNEYFPIFLANKTRPKLSLWEHREALKSLKEKGKLSIATEDAIFEALEKLDKIVAGAKTEKRKAKSEDRKKKTLTYLSDRNRPDKQIEDNTEPDFDNITIFNHSTKL